MSQSDQLLCYCLIVIRSGFLQADFVDGGNQARLKRQLSIAMLIRCNSPGSTYLADALCHAWQQPPCLKSLPTVLRCSRQILIMTILILSKVDPWSQDFCAKTPYTEWREQEHVQLGLQQAARLP